MPPSTPSTPSPPPPPPPPPPPLARTRVPDELDALCAALEPALLGRARSPGGSPGRTAVERALRAALPAAGVALDAGQAIAARRACRDPGSLRAVLVALGGAVGTAPDALARQLLAALPAEAAAAGSGGRPSGKANGRPGPAPGAKGRAKPEARPDGKQNGSPARRGAPASPRATLLPVSRFDAAFGAARVQAAAGAAGAQWGAAFARHAPASGPRVWPPETLEAASRRAGLHRGALPGALRARAVAAAGKAGLDRRGALRALAFLALHRPPEEGAAMPRAPPARLAPRDLAPAVDAALRAAVAALAAADAREPPEADAPPAPDKPGTPGTPDENRPRRLFLPGDAPAAEGAANPESDADEDEGEEDEAVRRAAGLPLHAAISGALHSSSERARKAREIEEAAAFAQSLDVPDEVADLRGEVERLRKKVSAVDGARSAWGVAPVIAATAGSAGFAVAALVAAEVCGLLGEHLPMLEQQFGALI